MTGMANVPLTKGGAEQHYHGFKAAMYILLLKQFSDSLTVKNKNERSEFLDERSSSLKEK
jgi:hypothetical protein